MAIAHVKVARTLIQQKPPFTLTCQFLLLHHFVFSQVDDEHMGQGLGGLLIDAAEDYSKRPLDAT